MNVSPRLHAGLFVTVLRKTFILFTLPYTYKQYWNPHIQFDKPFNHCSCLMAILCNNSHLSSSSG